MTRRAIAIGIAALTISTAAPARGEEPSVGTLDIEAAQAILAVQQLDGWLLYSNRNSNPVAVELVIPDSSLSRPWFLFVPAEGQPIALVHKSEIDSFTEVPGRKVEYTGTRDLKQGLREVLAGAKTIAMEFAPTSGIPSLTRVDVATVRTVRSIGVTIHSSAELVQFTKSLWRPEGRVAHYVAAHHLTKLRDEAMAYIADNIRKKKAITERDVQRFLLAGYKVRGLVGDPPVVAAGEHTADPRYVPSGRRVRAIREGDLVLLHMSAQLEGASRPIFADISWVAYVGTEVPERYAKVFAAVARARDETISLIRDRVSRRRPIQGFEADQKARAVIGEAGLADRFVYRTGYSLDTSRFGDGANLDDLETHDTRTLVQGAGFTVGPGVCVKNDFGVRSVVDVYIGPRGVEVTSPPQGEITPVLASGSNKP